MEKKTYEFTIKDSQIAKGIAILLMVIHHLFYYPERLHGVSYISLMSFRNTNIEFELGKFGGICVAMYLFLSGYGLYASSLKKQITLERQLKRIIEFFINYWVVFAFFVPIGLIFFNNNPVYSWNIFTFVGNLSSLVYSYNLEWWFVRLYIVLVILFPVIKSTLDNNRNKLYIISIICYGISIAILLIFKIFPSLIYIKNTLLFKFITDIFFWQISFVIGCIVAKYNVFKIIKDKIDELKLDKKWFYLITIIALIIIRNGMLIITNKFKINNPSAFDFLIAPIMVFVCSTLISKLKHISIFKLLGKHSTNIWLTHTFFAYYYFQELVFYPKISILVFVWCIILSLISSVIITFIVNKILKLVQYSRKNSNVIDIGNTQ